MKQFLQLIIIIFVNIVSDSNSDDIKNDNDNFFDEDIDNKVKATPHTTINAKVIRAMKKMQASYNDDAKKIVLQAAKEKSAVKNLNFLIDLVMATNYTKPVPEQPKPSMKLGTMPMKTLTKSVKKQIARTLLT